HVADGVLVLDGEDDAVAIPGIGDGLTEFTFSMMVYPTVDQVPLQFSGGINTDSWSGGIHFKLNNGHLNVGVNGLAGGDVVGTSIIEPDKWTHLVLTVSPEEVAVYVNGEKEGSRTGETVPAVNVGAATIGAWNNSGTDVQREMTGMMDDVLIYNRALSEGEVRYLAGERAGDPSLVIYYDFDDFGDIVADQSGKDHYGVVVGDVTAEAEGMYNGAANFATGSYLDLDGPSFPAEDIPTSAMTLAAWIKLVNTGGDHEIFNARASDETWVIHPEPKSSGDIRWLLRSYGGTTIFQIRAGVVTWDEWLHFAGTYDKESGKAALYINGELIQEMDVESPADIAGDWDMGARVGLTIDNGRPFTGLMDEFRMYTRALSQDDILVIMQGP
ncbi:LamG domain-containing protein, partial [Planctomycetota bacterium]